MSLAAVAAILGPGASAANSDTIQITKAWTRATPPGAKVGSGYVTITNVGKTSDRLTGVTMTFAERTEIHEMSMAGGTMKMRQLKEGIEIPAGESVTLRPGGLHLMHMGLNREPIEGIAETGTLRFEIAGDIEVTFQVGAVGSKEAPERILGSGRLGSHAADGMDEAGIAKDGPR